MDKLEIDAKNAVTSEAVNTAFELMWPCGAPTEMPNGYALLAGALRRAAPHIVREYLATVEARQEGRS